ncbi:MULTISPECIES: calcium/sodium antiporter [Arenibacter]|uniref:calcium/sodium antiporter n=1 Tax=Arenibacter TaxID=178469 RepID=UPI000A380B5E|nr:MULTISPECIES: calcium/sodium antiporter [Arenibacter]
MLIQILLIFLGLALLVLGADWLVKGASALAKRYNVSDLAIGLTIVAFGTSAPELVVNTFASYQNHQDIVFGNVIGSNNFNLFIILGLTGLLSPLVVQSSTVWKEIPISFIAIILLYLFANPFFSTGAASLSRIEGFVLLLMFGLFFIYVYKQLKTDLAEPEIVQNKLSSFKIVGLVILGLAGLVIGGRFVVINAIELATTLGMSEKIIGLTIVAAGTSLPELATSVVAVLKKNNDIAVGNVIGSNIFNIFFILAASSLINPIKYDTAFNTEIYLLAAGTIFLFIAMFTGQRKKLDRWEALILLVVYLAYMVYLIKKES